MVKNVHYTFWVVRNPEKYMESHCGFKLYRGMSKIKEIKKFEMIGSQKAILDVTDKAFEYVIDEE